MNLRLLQAASAAFLTSMCLRIAGLETLGTTLMVVSAPLLAYALLQPLIGDATNVIRTGIKEYKEWKTQQ